MLFLVAMQQTISSRLRDASPQLRQIIAAHDTHVTVAGHELFLLCVSSM